jgi:peptidoglycan lytic transglycosylase
MKMKMSYFPCLALCILLLVAGFAHASQAQQKAAKPASTAAKEETGNAIFYSDKLVGRPLTSGEKYDRNALTAAHRTLPLGTTVRVTNLKNNKSVVVRINDRGPHGVKSDIIDLSGRAAEELDLIKSGRGKVKLEVVEAANKK